LNERLDGHVNVLREFALGLLTTFTITSDSAALINPSRRRGFSDASHFVKVLRSRTGHTPHALQMRRARTAKLIALP
jgi:hypothetical protein